MNKWLAFVAAATLAACSSSSDSGGSTPDAATDVKADVPKIDAAADAGVTNLGKACKADADCITAGLTCLLTTGTDVTGGGPANGYCSVDCTADGAVCDEFDGACVDVSAASDGSKAFCFQTCKLGPSSAQSFSKTKCHARQDVACTQYVDSNQNPTSTLCTPLCASDADCSSDGSLKCDARTGVCKATVTTGDPDGTHCSGDRDAAPTCGGFCINFGDGDGGTLAHVCGGTCVLGNQNACGFDAAIAQNPPADGTLTMGGCLFVSDQAEGIGDMGLCGQLCRTDADCLDTADGAWCDTAQLIGQLGSCNFGAHDGGTGTDAGTDDASADAATE